jgi:hypothetical protein
LRQRIPEVAEGRCRYEKAFANLRQRDEGQFIVLKCSFGLMVGTIALAPIAADSIL